jgi:hypothetical protein
MVSNGATITLASQNINIKVFKVGLQNNDKLDRNWMTAILA